MSGFKFSLKKVGKPGKKNAPTKAKNVLVAEEEIESKTSIDGFSSRGAMSGATAVSEEPKLVIKPATMSTHLRRKAQDSNPQSDKEPVEKSMSADDKARESLLSGEPDFTNTAGIAIAAEDEDVDITEQDYSSVPVEQFGAALLRGMGWTGEADKPEVKLQNRKRGVVMGIGAKQVEQSLESEVMSKQATAPLRKREES